ARNAFSRTRLSDNNSLLANKLSTYPCVMFRQVAKIAKKTAIPWKVQHSFQDTFSADIRSSHVGKISLSLGDPGGLARSLLFCLYSPLWRMGDEMP
ncbi:MAG: hypothetical protein ACNA75_01415, partial [Thiohalomonadaceae bacterium]